MLKLIKLKTKIIEQSNNKEEINKNSLEIYTMLLGYFSNKKDSSFSNINEDDTLKELEKRILKLTNITYYKIIGIKNNNEDSFNIFISNISNENNKELIELLKSNFNYGYSYYDYYHNKYNSIFDYILLHKHQRLEYKLKNIIK